MIRMGLQAVDIEQCPCEGDHYDTDYNDYDEYDDHVGFTLYTLQAVDIEQCLGEGGHYDDDDN